MADNLIDVPIDTLRAAIVVAGIETTAERLARLNAAAIAADAHYSDIIRTLFGSNATRWTITAAQSCHADVRAASHAKLNADALFLSAFAAARKPLTADQRDGGARFESQQNPDIDY